MVASTATKTVKKTSAPKKAAAAKSAPSHPPYIEMITEALVSLKERTGSSHYAIAKHIEEQQKVRDLPPNFRKLLFNQLKKSVASGKLVMVKKSFKLPPGTSKKSPTAAPAAAEKPKAAAKPKSKEAAAKPAKKSAAAKPKAAGAKAKTTTAKAKASTTAAKKQKVSMKSPAKSPAKKVAPVKAKKPKSIKSPAKKATAVKKIVAMKKTNKK
ncbi:histone H1.1-like [Chenopodium quinoa]|uniref:H15 domain-containing protein n=1 Tax=Chenopodium quinoa TaxID=63459 RepID=A0A803L8Y8_CHEQI|nr:histone H1.1-like [Chenopodium quinoa]